MRSDAALEKRCAGATAATASAVEDDGALRTTREAFETIFGLDISATQEARRDSFGRSSSGHGQAGDSGR
jgi:hypothetical protein